MIVTIQLRRGTSSQWAASGRVLLSGEPGYDTTLKQLKLGDGSSPWDELDFCTLTPETLEQIEELLENLGDLDDTRMTEVLVDATSDFVAELAAQLATTGNPIGDALSTTIAQLKDLTVTRDSSGRVAAVTSSGITTSFGRDSSGRVTTMTQGAITKTISRDSAGRVTGIS